MSTNTNINSSDSIEDEHHKATNEEKNEGDIIREVHLKISPQYASFNVVPKQGEENDGNFPRNLHNAAELFLRVGMVVHAEKLKECTDATIYLYAENPDGKTGVRIGKACVCWNCGYCGLPKGTEFSKQNDSRSQLEARTRTIKKKKNKKKENTTPPGPCWSCNESDQINWIQVTQKKDKKIIEVPWIENAPLTAEEVRKKKDAELATKRADVEANVKKSLEERIAAANSDK